MLTNRIRRLLASTAHLGRRLARDETGATISAELVMVITATVLALAAGLDVLADAVTHELADLANAIHVDQTYTYNGLSAAGQASFNGGSFNDSDPFVEVTPVAPAGGGFVPPANPTPIPIPAPQPLPQPQPGLPSPGNPGDLLP